MKNIHHILPCGAVYSFKQHDYGDMAKPLTDYIFEKISREAINQKVNGSNYGRKKKPWATAYYSHMMRSIWKEVVEHILDSDRVIVSTEQQPVAIYVGKVPDNPKRITKKRKRSRAYFATDGVRYGINIDGFDHSYYFRMSYKNRLKLYHNLKAGKNYH